MHRSPAPTIPHLFAAAVQQHAAHHPDAAVHLCQQILALDPHHADSLHLLGVIALQAGDKSLAEQLVRQAISLNNQVPDYHSNLGVILKLQGRAEESIACYQAALRLKPDDAAASGNLGVSFRSIGQNDDAIAQYEAVLRAHPDNAAAHVNLGVELFDRGCLAEAAAHYEQALTLNPRDPSALFALSKLQLLCGDFQHGWQNYAHRWAADKQIQPRTYPQPLWNGQPLSAGKLLLWGEQGIGDEIMFASLLPHVFRTGISCLLECEPRLQPLFSRSFPQSHVRSAGQTPPSEFSAHLPTGSLPQWFQPAASPYLQADPTLRSRFRARYGHETTTIGLAWHTQNKKNGHLRSIPLPTFQPLFEIPGLSWISLQYGQQDALKHQILEAKAPLFLDHEVNQLTDMDTFAAQIAALDLVITIDNSTAHLAGALGVPVWLLLPAAADWRWLLNRNDTPWYPKMHLFRQSQPGSWSPLLNSVAKILVSTLKHAPATPQTPTPL